MDTKKKIGLNTIFFILTLVVNTLGGLGIINDMSQSDVSDKYFTLITPAGFTFSIWSVIYGLIAVSLVVLYLRRETSYYQRVLDKITPLFILTSVLNMAWIVLFSYELVELSTLFIFAYTIVLSLICKQLLAINDRKHFLLPLTFGLNTGWLMIATIVNVASSLVKLEWNGFGLSDDLWGMIILLVGILIVVFVTTQTHNAAIPLPIAWAYFGIHQSLATEHPGDYGILQLIAIIGLVVLIGVAAIQLYKNEYFILPKTPNDSNRLTTK